MMAIVAFPLVALVALEEEGIDAVGVSRGGMGSMMAIVVVEAFVCVMRAIVVVRVMVVRALSLLLLFLESLLDILFLVLRFFAGLPDILCLCFPLLALEEEVFQTVCVS